MSRLATLAIRLLLASVVLAMRVARFFTGEPRPRYPSRTFFPEVEAGVDAKVIQLEPHRSIARRRRRA